MNGRQLFTTEFNRIADQVLKQLTKLSDIAHDCRQRVVSDSRLTVFNGDLQIFESDLKNNLTVRRRKLSTLGSYPRISQQGLDQVLHPHGPIDRKPDKFFGLAIEFAFVAPGKQ